MSKKNADSRTFFINASYEFIHRILLKISVVQYEANARKVVYAIKQCSISKLRDIIGDYRYLEAFCKESIA